MDKIARLDGLVPDRLAPVTRKIVLEDFDMVDVAACWRGEPTPLLRAFLEESQRYASENWPDWAGSQPKAAELEKPGQTVNAGFHAAGLIDELSIHLVPVELGAGTRLFDAVVQTPAATHLRLALR